MSAYSNFAMDDDLSRYEPSPEFTSAITSHSEAPKWVLQTYYIGTMIFAIVAIVTAAGQIYTRMHCDQFKTPSSKTGSDIFEVFAWITTVVSFLIVIMSIYALITHMGYGAQITASYRKIFKPDKYDKSYRVKELHRKLGDQDANLMERAGQSQLQSSLDRAYQTPYPNLRV